ncbi:putative protein LONGIFOLIA [Helianthus annuus]|uniref:Putative DUF3741-associated sequence motif protein n=1 Tax=Helianthus annuus TaxID=4232 RepID=A0A251S1H6_HELAN|nr:protein LONGIFOLIA 1 [Helianthus annuus]KAF5791961.1 putative protein LONGIFOLIA 1/2 [Helianthus annuus]KAJ0526958.1 putative protein LONGIFOLIA [Helianthus annuus]KAJ0535532.1 putative protein LONGIFOLIA [Helianthus annuus]KAJ0543352.1 putative protein LONGIFOLIA [Helianthus annuus]KAJ0708404.1 putative protein LONGIFOLIA [Helianthus annuus]
MSTKVVHTLREDKQGLQKQLGCMNGIFQLFDRRYLLGLHRHGSIQNRLTAGEGGQGEKEFKNSLEKPKEKNQKKMIEKNGASVESSRNSFSSSCSSTTFSSFEGSRRVQNDWQLPSEPTSPTLHKKQPDRSLPPTDIRDVVKESMTREIRMTKHERAPPAMKHIDSPRPFIHQKSIQYDRKDRNLAKNQKSSSAVKEVKEISRFSCDERESQYSLKSTFKVKEPPRLSLDSKQNSHSNFMNGPGSEPGSNKRPSSGVVARLMGLDSLTDSVCEVESLKIKQNVSDQPLSNSPRVHSRIRPALQQYEGSYRAKKPSVYGEMEKMLNELKFSTSGKDLRALKQILEAIQMTKTGVKNQEQSLEIQKPDQPCSPSVKGTSSPKRRELVNRAMKPAKMATELKMMTGHHDVNHTDRKQVNGRTPKNMKETDRTTSPRLQKPKNDVDKQCFNGPSSNLKTKHPRIKPINPMQNNGQSFRCNNDSDKVSFKSKGKTNLASQSKLEVPRNDQPKKNQRNNFAERLIEDIPMVKLAKLSVEQPSPDSVLDAFFIEDTPSPIKNKPNENLRDDQTEWMNNTEAEAEHVKLENKACAIQKTESSKLMDETLVYPCKTTNEDHRYIREILSASGFLKDLDSAIRQVQLHPTCSLIKPDLFHLLENPRSNSNEKIRRKMIFDSVNEILFHKLVSLDGKRCGKFMNGEKLLEELWSEIDTLQKGFRRCTYNEDDDDEVINIVSADLNKKSEDWGKCCYEVQGVVLDIERLIFKDLIDEVINVEVASLQHRQRHCRRLFSI